jgi:decaprenylphospho-beta-D-erythro-pentofuranosid-2-ulose 2-reductase
MTAGMTAAPLATTPDAVARAVLLGCEENRRIVWVPSVLRWVFLALRHLPQSLWRRLPG